MELFFDVGPNKVERCSLGSLVLRRVRLIVSDTTRSVLILAAAMAMLIIPLAAFSQASQGTIQGGVFDQSGGAIPGATVTVTDVARGVKRAFTTDGAGEYVATNLTPGTYTVRAEAKGFRPLEHSGVLLEVGQNVRVDLVVQPGEQTQTITVTGELPAVDTTDAMLGGTVSNQSINALPLNGRNFQRLLQLRPGVVTSPGAATGGASTNGRRIGNDVMVVEGITQIDQTIGNTGIMNTSYRGGDSSSVLPIDAIQEFNTEQNPKAEYGWKDGSVISVGVKSGTNSVHGTAYAFGRDASATDAANYFSTPGVTAVTPATLEQFGATAGGPIIKDKLFWFAAYEGLRDLVGDVVVSTIPSDISVGDPTKSMVDACNALGRTNVSPLSAQLSGLPAGSCVPQPASSTFENLFPYNPSASNNFAPGLPSTGPLNNGLFKIDYDLNQRQHLNGMYYVSKAEQVTASAGELLPQWELNVGLDVQMYGGSWTWSPNSAWVNDFRTGYVYLADSNYYADANKLPSNPWPNGYDMPTGVTNPAYGGLPEISLSGFSGFLGAGSRSGFKGPEGDADFVDSVSYLRGKHAFKFGFEYLDALVDQAEETGVQGSVSFMSLETFLAGAPNNGSILVGNPTQDLRSHWYAAFVQDDWRVTPRVTLNLGLRYQYQTPPTERNNYIGGFNPNVNPATTPAVQQVGPSEPIPSEYNGDPKDFSPRIGVAWDIKGDGKTVIRAGASLLRTASIMLQLVYSAPFGANFPGIGVNNSGTAINAHTPDTLNLAAGSFSWNLTGPIFPVAANQVVNGVTYSGVTCTAATPCSTGTTAPNWSEPSTAEWNLDVQRAITNNFTVDVAYVANHGFNEYFGIDLNQPPIGVGWAGTPAANCLASAPLYNNCKVSTAQEVGRYSAEFPYLNNIMESENGGSSNYDALQVTASQRIAHGLSFIAGYTYSHALDEQSSGGQSLLQPTDANNLRLNYGASTSDLRHRFTFAPTYLIPGRRSPGQMLEGWSLSSIITLQSGLPWFPDDTTTDDLLGTGENRNRFASAAAGVVQFWNYTGPISAFSSGPQAIPCYGPLSGCTHYSVVGGVPQIPAACLTAAQAPYAPGSTDAQLALAAVTNLGCYVQNGGVLTPPAYGTVGDASRDIFRAPAYYNVDLSVSKLWKFRERYSAQFRVEFFNFFNRADFAVPSTDPSKGFTGQFGCSCSTPDSSNPVFGSGGPRHIQFGLKLTY